MKDFRSYAMSALEALKNRSNKRRQKMTTDHGLPIKATFYSNDQFNIIAITENDVKSGQNSNKLQQKLLNYCFSFSPIYPFSDCFKSANFCCIFGAYSSNQRKAGWKFLLSRPFHFSSSFSAAYLSTLLASLTYLSSTPSTIFCASAEALLMIFLASVIFFDWNNSSNLSVWSLSCLSSPSSLHGGRITSGSAC